MIWAPENDGIAEVGGLQRLDAKVWMARPRTKHQTFVLLLLRGLDQHLVFCIDGVQALDLDEVREPKNVQEAEELIAHTCSNRV